MTAKEINLTHTIPSPGQVFGGIGIGIKIDCRYLVGMLLRMKNRLRGNLQTSYLLIYLSYSFSMTLSHNKIFYK